MKHILFLAIGLSIFSPSKSYSTENDKEPIEFYSVWKLADQQNNVNPEYSKLAKDIFKELIEINTTSTYGSTKAAEAMAARLKSAGFSGSDIQVIGQDDQNKNLVFRYHGTGKLKPILFICHLDVVQALRSDWSVDPFTFTEKDGYFYGRGTTDIKNDDASLIANVIRLKNEGFHSKP